MKCREEIAVEEPHEAGRDEVDSVVRHEWGHFNNGPKITLIDRMLGLNQLSRWLDQSLGVNVSAQPFVSNDVKTKRTILIAATP